MVISSANFSMEMIARGWLVYELTGSALVLSLVGSGWSISMLLVSLFAGALCDRIEKKDLLMWMRAAMVLNALALGVLIWGGVVRVWVLFASSLLSGVLFSFLMPAQQAITAELVDRETLLNAVALNSIGMGAMGILASSLAGFVIDLAGVEGVYFLMAAVQLVAVFTVTKLPATGRRGSSTGTIWSGLIDGLRHVQHRPVLLAVLGLVLGRVLFAMPYRTFMPMFAKEVMGFDAAGLGVLMAAPGIGSLVSSLVVASLGDFRNKGRLLLVSGVAMGICLMLYVGIPLVAATFLFLAMVGAAGNVCMVTNQTLLQVNTEDAYRGRVMSVYMLMWGLSPLGTLPAGVLADRLGVSPVIALQGALLVLVFGAVALFGRDVRRLE